MSKLMQEMLDEANGRYNKIYPVGGRKQWSECFTEDMGFIILWFDTEDRSTHVVTRKVTCC